MTPPIRFAAMAMGLVVSLFAAQAASAAPPANDGFASSQAIPSGLPRAASGTTVDATGETGEPQHMGFPAQRSVWYSWSPTASGSVKVSACGEGGFGPFPFVYTGSSVGALTPVSGGQRCSHQFDAVAGTTYRIAVDYFGMAPFALRLSSPAPPANDDFADAQAIPASLPARMRGSNADATVEAGEPSHHPTVAPSASVWFAWTATSSGRMRLDTCPSASTAPYAVVYTGSQPTSLTRVAALEGGACRLAFDAVAGTTYRIVLDSIMTGPYELVLRPALPPPNDSFAGAQTVGPALPIDVAGDTTDATSEPGEPDHSSNGYGPSASIWYRWVPQQTVLAMVNGCDSGGSTRVYTGGSLDSLAPAPASSTKCRYYFVAVAGQEYRIAIDAPAEGPTRLRIHELSEPPNDDFDAAQARGPAHPPTVSGTTVDSSAEAGEPSHSTFTGSVPESTVWYRWTPAETVEAKLSVCETVENGDQTDLTFLGVYTGDSLDALTPVASSAFFLDFDCYVEFTAQAGVTYKIAVETGTDQFPFELVLRSRTAPTNDDFEDSATLPPGLPVARSGSTIDATRQDGEPNAYGPGAIPHTPSDSVWFDWTPQSSGQVVLDVCESRGAVTAVYTGDALGSLARVNWGGCRLLVSATAGVTYRIVVDGRETDFDLDLHPYSPPANDDFAAATTIAPTRPIQVGGTTVDAGPEEGDPGAGQGIPAAATVWYRWTPSVSGEATIDTCAGGPNTVMSVFTGSDLAFLERVARDDDGCGTAGGPSRVTLEVTAGTTYSILVDTGYARYGRSPVSDFVLSISETGEIPVTSEPRPSVTPPVVPEAGPTGKRAAALKKCKKLKGKRRGKCAKKAKKLPV